MSEDTEPARDELAAQLLHGDPQQLIGPAGGGKTRALTEIADLWSEADAPEADREAGH